MPPAVGYFDTSFDIENANSRISPQMIGHPHEMAFAPPLFHACPYVVKQPARTEMIVKEIAKFEKELHDRWSACVYPSSASLRSSEDCCCGATVSAMTRNLPQKVRSSVLRSGAYRRGQGSRPA